MNKYQKMILENTSINFTNSIHNTVNAFKLDNDELSLYQDDNYNITKYNLLIESKCISEIELFNKKWETIKNYQDKFYIDIDFDNQIRKIKLIFSDDIADPLILNINYIYANRDDYDLKLKEKSEDLLSRKACIRVTTGINLLNVLFQPVGSNYSYTIIELYSFMDNIPLLMARYKVTDELYFLPIKDLAFGTYKIRVIEYGSSDEEIFSSPFYVVTLQRPRSVSNQNYDR